MAHGYSLTDCEFYVKERMLHPLIEKCYIFLRNFKETAANINIIYNIYNIPFSIIIHYNKNDNEYFIYVYFNYIKINKYSYTLDELHEFSHFLDIPYEKIFLNELKPDGRGYNKTDITDKIK